MTTRRRILCVCIALLVMCSIGISVFAAGRYAASRESTVYHRANCHYVDNILSGNLIWFATIRQAEVAGYRPCSRCHPDWEDWEYNPDSGKDSGKDNESSGNRTESNTTIPKVTKPTTPSEGQPEDESKWDVGEIIAIFVYGGIALILAYEFFGTRKRKPKSAKTHQENPQLLKKPEPQPPARTTVSYDNGTLYLTLADGSKYAYQNVPEAVYKELLASPSRRQFFKDNIQGIYPYYKIQ